MPAKKTPTKKNATAKRNGYSMQSLSQRKRVGRRVILFRSKAFLGGIILLVLAIAGLSFLILQRKDTSEAATNGGIVKVSGGNFAACNPSSHGADNYDGCFRQFDNWDGDDFMYMLRNANVSYDLPSFTPNNRTDDSTPGPTREITLYYGQYSPESTPEPIQNCSYKYKVQVDSQEKINNQFVTTSSKTLNLPIPSPDVQSDAYVNYQPYKFYAGARNNNNSKRLVLKWLNNEHACSVAGGGAYDMNLMVKKIEYSALPNQTRDSKLTLRSSTQSVPSVLRVQSPSKISSGVVKAVYLTEAEKGLPFISIPSGGYAEYKISAQSTVKYLQINEILAKAGSGQLTFKLNGQTIKATTTINSNGIKEKVILPVSIPKGSSKTLRIEAKNAKMLFTNITMSTANDSKLQAIYR